MDDQLIWRRIAVDGRMATFGVGGVGPPVVFLHGWGLGSRAYGRAISRLARRGCRVFAPALPGLGGTADLPREERSMAGYADWVAAFMAAVGVDGPALVIGHSFGGGVATQLACAHPERVGYLVLLNSVGGPADRPIWAWGLHLAREMLPDRRGIEVFRAVRHDLFDNVIHNPCGLIRVGRLARAADLSAELAELGRRAVPVLALTTDDDIVIPQSAFAALCRAIGTDGEVLTGRHAWLLSDPDTFAEVLGNVVEVRLADHQQRGASTRATEIADALRSTQIPVRTAHSLLKAAPPLWLMSAPAAVLAGDLALCHPRLGRHEVRAVARREVDSDAVRLTVAAADRAGLLADTAGLLAAHHLSIGQASAATWPTRRLALHALTVHGAAGFTSADWDRLGADLADLARSGARPRPGLVGAPASVSVYGASIDRSLVRVTAPDQIGLLWAISDWFARHGVSIESLDASTADGVAHDVFLVSGAFDASDLSRHLTGGTGPRPPARDGCARQPGSAPSSQYPPPLGAAAIAT